MVDRYPARGAFDTNDVCDGSNCVICCTVAAGPHLGLPPPGNAEALSMAAVGGYFYSWLYKVI
jgi:hypothetical protein